MACSGSNTNKTPPPPTRSQFELDIKLTGLGSKNISFSSLGKNYTVNSDQKLKSNITCSPPLTNLVFLDSQLCTSQINKLNDTHHELMINCKKKIKIEFSPIFFEEKPPYSVEIKINKNTYRIENKTINTNINPQDEPIITSSIGPLLCDFIKNNKSNDNWILKCEESLTSTEETSSVPNINVKIITQNKEITLDIDTLVTSEAPRLYSYNAKQYFLSGNTIYSLTLDHDTLAEINKYINTLSNLVQHSDELYSLVNNGLYKFTSDKKTVKKTLSNKTWHELITLKLVAPGKSTQPLKKRNNNQLNIISLNIYFMA
ncbi:hypothetical protein PTD2_09164 [Pseudoalteromonas tunicata D2]|uniref:Uncharacterized protein n=1 Tax=Pseudoalteromonas tunicata D2 TaxID=87626 RepID=A4C9D8_9GAMM|nr:hypothetical protein PTD2_09164 [Pseudoalteromonas tunicata D2]